MVDSTGYYLLCIRLEISFTSPSPLNKIYALTLAKKKDEKKNSSQKNYKEKNFIVSLFISVQIPSNFVCTYDIYIKNTKLYIHNRILYFSCDV